MEQADSLTLSIIFLDGYDAAQAGQPHDANPCEGELAVVWFNGWDKGNAIATRPRRFVDEDPPMKQEQPKSAFASGSDSGWDGAPRTDNPHKADSAEAEQWLQGWAEGLVKRDAVMPSRMQAMSAPTETEPSEPGEKGELAAIQGEPPTANPYVADSAEAEEWLDGHDYATSTEAEAALPHLLRPPLGPDRPADGMEKPSQGLTVPAAGEA